MVDEFVLNLIEPGSLTPICIVADICSITEDEVRKSFDVVKLDDLDKEIMEKITESQRPKILYQFPDQAGKSYRPSNGTEGMVFEEAFCDRCKNCDPDPDGDVQCDILFRALNFWDHESEYPKEWVYDKEGWPICTAWKYWDWNNGPPEPPDPYDPHQLKIKFK